MVYNHSTNQNRMLSIPLIEVIEATYGETTTTKPPPSLPSNTHSILKKAGAMLSIPIGEAADTLGR
jgi:hypothetical protein